MVRRAGSEFAELHLCGLIPAIPFGHGTAFGLAVHPLFEHDAETSTAHAPAALVFVVLVFAVKPAIAHGAEPNLVAFDDRLELSRKQPFQSARGNLFSGTGWGVTRNGESARNCEDGKLLHLVIALPARRLPQRTR